MAEGKGGEKEGRSRREEDNMDKGLEQRGKVQIREKKLEKEWGRVERRLKETIREMEEGMEKGGGGRR